MRHRENEICPLYVSLPPMHHYRPLLLGSRLVLGEGSPEQPSEEDNRITDLLEEIQILKEELQSKNQEIEHNVERSNSNWRLRAGLSPYASVVNIPGVSPL